MFLGVVCSVVMGVSRTAGNFIMNMLSFILLLAFRGSDDMYSATSAQTLGQIPSSIDEALAGFRLDGRCVVYAVCPTCHCTYKPRVAVGSDTAIYPARCTNIRTPGSGPCSESLVRETNGDEGTKPRKTFVYYLFFDYLAFLLSRADLERIRCSSKTSASRRWRSRRMHLALAPSRTCRPQRQRSPRILHSSMA